MDLENIVIDLSSDEDEKLNMSVIDTQKKLKWLRDHLFKDDEDEGDLDEVVFVREVLNSNISVDDALISYLDGKVRGADDDDDCVILEGDPDKMVLVEENQDSGSDDLIVVGEKGEIACRDYPHSRHLCVKYPFSSTLHNCHCELCHCYVCDVIAPCEFWGTGLSTLDHCHAIDKQDDWKTLRNSFKLKKCSYLPATRDSIDTSSAVPSLKTRQIPDQVQPFIAMPINHVTRPAVIPTPPRPAVLPAPKRLVIRPSLPRPIVRPAHPAHDVHPAPSANAVHPAPSAHAVRPAHPAHEVHLAHPAHEVHLAHPAHAVHPAPPHAVRPAPPVPAVRRSPPVTAVLPVLPRPPICPAHSRLTLPALSMKVRIMPSSPAIQHRPSVVGAHTLQSADTGVPNSGSGSNMFSQSSGTLNLAESYKNYTGQKVRRRNTLKLEPHLAVFKNQDSHQPGHFPYSQQPMSISSCAPNNTCRQPGTERPTNRRHDSFMHVNGSSRTNTSAVHSSSAAYYDATDTVNQSIKQRMNCPLNKPASLPNASFPWADSTSSSRQINQQLQATIVAVPNDTLPLVDKINSSSRPDAIAITDLITTRAGSTDS